MNSLTNWYKRSPFWEGAASAFDLLGVSGFSINDARRILSAKRRYNAIKENFDLVRKKLIPKLEKYEREFQKNQKVSK